MDMKQALFALSACTGPSGAEQGVFETAKEILKPYVRSVTRDVMGNLIGIRTAKKRSQECILLDAHLDEVGMLVTDHDKGYLKFAAIGIDPRILPGLEVKVCTEPPMFGVVTCLPPHVVPADEREKAFEMDDLRVDCGLSEEEAAARVPVGTRIVYGTKPFTMGKSLVCGKSLDDRACFVILCRVMELLKDEELPLDVCVLGSVQEEYTALGAATGAYNMMPTEAIVADVSFAETPDTPKAESKPLGTGPMIGVGPVENRRMSQKLIALAKENGIPYTREVLPGRTGTNADEIQISREGVAVCNVSLPLRYMHTPIEVVDLEDMEHSAQLIAAYIRSRKEDAPC